MSAGFIFQIAAVPTWTGQEAADALSALGFKELVDAAEDAGIFYEDDQPAFEFRGEVYARLIAAKDYCVVDIEYPFSDVGWFVDKDGEKFVLSGGMSSGDSPTEAFDHIQVLAAFEYYINERTNP